MYVQGKCRSVNSNNRKSEKIRDRVFFKIRVYLYGMVKKKKVLLEYSHCIKAHIDIIGEAFEVHSSVALEFFLEEEFIEFW